MNMWGLPQNMQGTLRRTVPSEASVMSRAALIGLISTILAFGASRLCLVLMGEYIASMGIVLDSARIYPLELAIMALIFIISVIPTVICTLNMSRKDGLSE